MRISRDNLKTIVNEYQKILANKRIENIVLVNSRLFLFFLRKEKRQLIVDLDNVNPHIGILETNYNELSLPSEFIAKTMNKGAPFIEKIEIINDDRVVRITTSASDAYYHRNKYYLYIELINAHANMILTDEHNTIIVGFYETAINAVHPIVKNIQYELLDKKEENNLNKPFSMKEYQGYVKTSFISALEKRKKELYGPYIKKYEKKVKSLTNKIKKINESKENAKHADKYKEYGENLLMNINEIKRGANEYNDIKLDPSKSVIENANLYFSKYKKAKRTIETTTEILKSIENELDENRYFLDIFTLGDENDIKNFIDVGYKKKKREQDIKAYLPYHINIKNVHYYYGKNAIQNDYLTFKMFKSSSDVTWLHVKDKPSSHMIINIANPSNEQLDIACSILLLINKLTSAEIMYTKRKNITRDNALASVNVLQYKSINMRKINPIASEYLKKEKRTNE